MIEMMCRLEERRGVFSALGAGHPNRICKRCEWVYVVQCFSHLECSLQLRFAHLVVQLMVEFGLMCPGWRAGLTMVVDVACFVIAIVIRDGMHEGSSCVVLPLCFVVGGCLLGWVIVNGGGGVVVRP